MWFTIENESGLANASGAVEDERLRHSVVLGVIVENSLDQWPRDYPPWLTRHFYLWMQNKCYCRRVG